MKTRAMKINHVELEITGKIKMEEVNEYIQYLENKQKCRLERLEIIVDGEFVDLRYEYEKVPFERIRRITGYLTGTMDTWNGAKSAEEHDRVKHETNVPMEELGKDLKEIKHKYGEYKNVLLTDEEMAKLKNEFIDYEDRIERLSEYIESKGVKYKSHLATIRAWARKDVKSGAVEKTRRIDW